MAWPISLTQIAKSGHFKLSRLWLGSLVCNTLRTSGFSKLSKSPSLLAREYRAWGGGSCIEKTRINMFGSTSQLPPVALGQHCRFNVCETDAEDDDRNEGETNAQDVFWK